MLGDGSTWERASSRTPDPQAPECYRQDRSGWPEKTFAHKFSGVRQRTSGLAGILTIARSGRHWRSSCCIFSEVLETGVGLLGENAGLDEYECRNMGIKIQNIQSQCGV